MPMLRPLDGERCAVSAFSCHPDGAVFWRRRTYATLPAVLRFLNQPVDMLGHNDITDDQKAVSVCSSTERNRSRARGEPSKGRRR